MRELYTNRRFAYKTDMDEIKHFLAEQRLIFSDRLHSQTGEPLAIIVEGTTVRIGYPTIMQGGFINPGKPMISVLNTPETTNGDLDMAKRSVALYEKLYRRFREKARK